MSAAAAKPAEWALDVAAGHILALLAEQTTDAQALVAAGDGSSLQVLLEARGVMLEELDGTVRALGAEKQRATRNPPPISVHRDQLMAMARDLERANAQLLATATAECLSIAAAIKDLDRPDEIASAYASTEGDTTRRLDLIR